MLPRTLNSIYFEIKILVFQLLIIRISILTRTKPYRNCSVNHSELKDTFAMGTAVFCSTSVTYRAFSCLLKTVGKEKIVSLFHYSESLLVPFNEKLQYVEATL